MPSTALIQQHLKFLDTPAGKNLVAYQISGHANGDAWNNILVVFNGGKSAQTLEIPAGKWKVVLEGGKVSEQGLREVEGGKVEVGGISGLLLCEQ